MSQIQRSYLDTQTIVPPLAFMGLALLAGRFIQYFPKTSQVDLLIAAGAASATSIFYDYAVHSPDHTYLQTLLGKAAAIALATFGTAFATKALRGRAVAARSIARFGAIECVALAIITYVTQESPLQRTHRYYTTHLKEWRALEAERLSQLMKDFYQAKLPPISLLGVDFDKLDLSWLDSQDEVFENLQHYSPEQLGWYGELYNVVQNLGEINSFSNMRPSFEQFLLFIKRCQECKAEWRWFFNFSSIEFMGKSVKNSLLSYNQEHPHSFDPFYAMCQQVPIYYFSLFQADDLDKTTFDTIFQGKAPLPTFEETVRQLSAAQVEKMAPSLLKMWHQVLEVQDDTLSQQPVSVCEALVKCFFDLKCLDWIELPFYGDISWINALSQEELKSLSREQQGWILNLRQNSPDVAIAFKTIHTFNKQYYANLHYTLTCETITQAQQDEAVLAALKDQFKALERKSDYGFSSLPIADQITLKKLFESDKVFLPPYLMTAEVVAVARNNADFLEELKTQFVPIPTNPGQDYGLFNLSKETQDALRSLFGDAAYLLPYQMTPELVDQAQNDPKLVDHLKYQFEKNKGIDYGFKSLPEEKQTILRNLFGDKASLLTFS